MDGAQHIHLRHAGAGDGERRNISAGASALQIGNRITVSARDFPTNKGGLCRKGWTAAELLEAPDRLTTPLMRDHKGDELHRVSWDEALERIASEMRSISERYGRDAVAVFGGG